MYRLLVILLGFILGISALFAQQFKEKKEADKSYFVMILSSYLYESEWSTSLAKEIRNKLETRNSDLKVHITYAGINSHKSYLSDRFAMQGAFAYGRINNQIVIPKVLVLIGDESWMLYRSMNLRGIWNNVAVVLCCVHPEIMKDYRTYFPDTQIPDSSLIPLKSSVTNFRTAAILEPDNSIQTIILAKKLMPQLKQLYYLTDGSYWDCYQKTKLAKAIKNNSAEITLTELKIGKNNVDSVYEVLNQLSDKTIILTNGVKVPETVRVPVLTLREIVYKNRMPLGGHFAPITEYAQKVSEAVSCFLDEKQLQNNTYYFPTDTAYYLNKEALMNTGLYSKVSDLPNKTDWNAPLSFFLRHARMITILLLIGIVVVYVIVRASYMNRYQQTLKVLFNRYKKLYNEYQVIYENMPVGLMLFDINGNLLNRNAETNAFMERFAHSEMKNFHLFNSDILDIGMREALFHGELVNRMLIIKPYCYRFLLRQIDDEETGEDCILAMIIDNTDIEQEKEKKDQICEVLNFAMDKSSLGVAEYNLMDYTGFATDAWYDMLNLGQRTENFSSIHKFLIEKDREKIERYLELVRNGISQIFLDSLQMEIPGRGNHYVRYLIQPLEYIPEKNRIIVSELILNIDEQVAREHELKFAMEKVQEADRLKNAFVANMKDEIRMPLNEIIDCAKELVTISDTKQRQELNSRIEKSNERLLALLQHIIDVSKIELNQ